MNPLVHVLTGRVVDGVWWAADLPDDPASLIGAFGRLALVVEADGDKTRLLERFAVAGRFPRWVGHNWDALEDALTDLSWLPADDVIVVLETERSALPVDGLDGREWSVLLDVLGNASNQWARAGRRFSTVVVGRAARGHAAVAALPDLGAVL